MSTFEQALANAATLGAQRGEDAAAWVFDGNTTDETYRTFLRWSDAGDPLLDTFAPPSWLSGEWSSDLNYHELPAECGWELPEDEDGDWRCDELASAYEDAADVAYWAELERTARRAIA